MEQLNSKQKEERLRLIKRAYAQRQTTKNQHTEREEKLGLKKTEKKEMHKDERAIMPTQNTRQETSLDELNGEEKTMNELENKTTNGIQESNTQSANNNALVESETDRSMGLKEHLNNLREAGSQSMNLLDSTTEHLHGLMIGLKGSFQDRNKEQNNIFQTKEIISQTVSIASQLHKSMKLKLDTIKTLHKMSKDIEEN